MALRNALLAFGIVVLGCGGSGSGGSGGSSTGGSSTGGSSTGGAGTGGAMGGSSGAGTGGGGMGGSTEGGGVGGDGASGGSGGSLSCGAALCAGPEICVSTHTTGGACMSLPDGGTCPEGTKETYCGNGPGCVSDSTTHKCTAPPPKCADSPSCAACGTELCGGCFCADAPGGVTCNCAAP